MPRENQSIFDFTEMFTLFIFNYRLVLSARSLEALQKVEKECKDLGAEVLIVPTDVSKETDCKYVSYVEI